MASQGSIVPDMASCGGVATQGVGFPTSWPLAPLGPSMQKLVACVGVAMIDVATLGVGSPE
jgi:hypothetical protein